MSQEPKAPEPGTVTTPVDKHSPSPTSADAPHLFPPPSFDKFRGPLPPFLYHYTGLDGLLGIVEKSELWATNVNYMNDATEFRIALKMAGEQLSAEVNNAPSNSKRKQAACTLNKEVAHIQQRGICAICFCSDGNLLSQWRGYSGHSYGFSIGFNSGSLKSFGGVSRSDRAPFELARCIYDEDTQKRIVQEICDHYLSHDIASSLDENFRTGFGQTLRMYGAFFKDVSFTQEEEWRLVASPVRPDKWKFRGGKSLIIPYYTMGIGEQEKSSICHVYVGPCPHMKLSKASVKALLAKYGISALVQCSDIPFRGRI